MERSVRTDISCVRRLVSKGFEIGTSNPALDCPDFVWMFSVDCRILVTFAEVHLRRDLGRCTLGCAPPVLIVFLHTEP